MPCLCCYKRLAADEQLRVEWNTGVKVYNGPGLQCFYCPAWCKGSHVVKAESLGALDYLKIKNTLGGVEHIEKGPKQVFMGASEKVVGKGTGMICSPMEYVRIEDTLTGNVQIQKGPCTWFPNTNEVGTKGTAIACNDMEYVQITDTVTGGISIRKGPCIWFPGSAEVGTKEQCTRLHSVQYVVVTHKLSGKKRTVQGPCCWFPEPYEESSEIQMAYSLKAYEFVRLVNTATGEIRSLCGEQMVFPGPEEKLLDGKVMEAVKLKRYEFVEILDEASGEIRTIHGPNQIFLGPYERITREANALQKSHVQCGNTHVLCASGLPSVNTKPSTSPQSVGRGMYSSNGSMLPDTASNFGSNRQMGNSLPAMSSRENSPVPGRRFEPISRKGVDSPSNSPMAPGVRFASPQRDRPVEG